MGPDHLKIVSRLTENYLVLNKRVSHKEVVKIKKGKAGYQMFIEDKDVNLLEETEDIKIDLNNDNFLAVVKFYINKNFNGLFVIL